MKNYDVKKESLLQNYDRKFSEKKREKKPFFNAFGCNRKIFSYPK
jgi:hypothetical protein